MEWQGINLTDFRLKQWKRQIYKQCCYLALMSVTALAVASFLHFTAVQIKQQNRPLIAQIHRLKQDLAALNDKLEQSRRLPIVNINQTFTAEQIAEFLNLLQNLPLPQGGIEEVIFEYSEIPSMRISGIFINSGQFERLEKYLSEQKAFRFSLANFQINEQQQIEFSFNITFRE